MPMPSRSPVKMNGSAAGSTTRIKRLRGGVPSIKAARTRFFGVCSAPVVQFTTIG